MQEQIKRKPGRPPGPRPELRKYPGVLGQMRLGWNRMKAQAKFRRETFKISWEQYQTIWDPYWPYKGRTVESVCLTRIDWEGAWDIDNVEIVERAEHLRRQRQLSQKYRRRARLCGL